VSRERWEALTPQREKTLCPDFVVELRSPTDNLKKLQAKMQEYIEQGTARWLMIQKLSRWRFIIQDKIRKFIYAYNFIRRSRLARIYFRF